MNKIILVVFISFALVIATNRVFAQGVSGSASFAQKLPNFSLKDPVGKTFTKQSLCKNGVVLVVTAPILSGESAQKGWSQYLSTTRSDSKAKWVYVEDLEPSAFKDEAMSGMKKDYMPGKEPILLIDTNGKLRRALKVSEKSTVVLVYNSAGKLVHFETGGPSPEAAAAIWEKVKG